MLFGELFHPQAANATIGFFKTGAPITVAVQGPSSPAVAGFTVSGIVTASDGATGLRNVRVTLTDQNGVVGAATTSSFGFYAFDNVAPGQSYTVRVSSQFYRFQPRLIQVAGDLANVNFVGLE